MCGIAGIVGLLPDKKHKLNKMLDVLYHRGPDQKFLFQKNEFCAGMRRLSINDVEGGVQPFFNKNNTVAVLYNGEIYNYKKLRSQLECSGKKFCTASDGEVIAHLYEDVGEAAIEYLDGMFAIAIWDIEKGQLLLARDIHGEKPLYYYKDNNRLVFASEIKSIETLSSDIELRLNHQATWDFPTFLWIPEPCTVYNEIKAIPAGHILSAKNNVIKIKPYKYKFTSQISDNLSESEWVELTRYTVEEAVKSRLQSDVPVGCFLSGGLDSSIVSTVASQNLEHLDTFTVSFENVSDPYHGNADESIAAADTAKLIGSNHHTVHVTASSIRNNLDKFCKYGDQPFSVSSGLGIMAIAEAAQESGIKVLLTGDGADECFGGYSWYKYLAALSVKNATTEKKLNTAFSFQNFGVSINDRLNQLASMNPNQRAWAWHYYAHENEKSALYSSEWSRNVESSLRYFDAIDDKSTPIDYIRHDKAFYFPNEMLTKVDRMAMAFSVEGRTPFAEPNVSNIGYNMPIKYMVRGDTLKWVLRKAFEDILPMEVINRPKHGFNVPIDHWLKNEWSSMVEEAFEKGSMLYKHGIIDDNSYEVACSMLSDNKRLNGHTIFSMIMLNKWLGQ